MWSTLIAKYCAGVSFSLVTALIGVESGGNPQATHRGNFGLMQIRVNTARMLKCTVKNPSLCEINPATGIEDCQVLKGEQLYDPDTNINCGCTYLRYQQKRYKSSLKDIIAAYNLGSVFKQSNGTYKNQKYVTSVLRKMGK